MPRSSHVAGHSSPHIRHRNTERQSFSSRHSVYLTGSGTLHDGSTAYDSPIKPAFLYHGFASVQERLNAQVSINKKEVNLADNLF